MSNTELLEELRNSVMSNRPHGVIFLDAASAIEDGERKLAAAEKVIAQAVTLYDNGDTEGGPMRDILVQSPTDALAAYSKGIADASWKRGYDACREGKQRHSPYA